MIGGMSSFDQRLRLAKGVIPAVAMIVFVIARGGVGLMIVPFIVVAVIGIVQTLRRSGVIGGRRLQGSITESAAHGHASADEILGQRD
jgi:hypothetical protein